MKIFFIYNFLFILLLTGTVQQACSDEVLTTVDEALSQYTQGDYDSAANNLDFAAQLIRQKKSDALKEMFPDPLAGWEAGPATSQGTGTAVFGRSVSVSRKYIRKTSTITIDIVSDSPVMQSLVMMLNNPVIAGAGGAKLETFSSHKGIVQYNEKDRNGDVNIVVDDRFMVTVEGQSVARGDLISYANAVKFAEFVQ